MSVTTLHSRGSEKFPISIILKQIEHGERSRLTMMKEKIEGREKSCVGLRVRPVMHSEGLVHAMCTL